MKKIIAVIAAITFLASCEPSIPTTQTVRIPNPGTVSAIELGTLRKGHATLYKINVDSIEYILFYDYDNSSIIKHRDLRNASK